MANPAEACYAVAIDPVPDPRHRLSGQMVDGSFCGINRRDDSDALRQE